MKFSTMRIASLLTIMAVMLTSGAVHAQSVKIEDAVFAKSFENGAPESPGTKFFPDEKIVLRVTLGSRPKRGLLSCKFFFGKQQITTVSADLAELETQGVPDELNAFGEFSLKPIQPFPVGDQYRAEVFYDDEPLGSYKFQVVARKPTYTSLKPNSSSRERTSGTASGGPTKTTKEIVNILLDGTALVVARDDQGNSWTGTAWLLDRDHRLLVTNNHVVDTEENSGAVVEELQLYFPEYKNGHLIHDVDFYLKRAEPIAVQTIFADPQRDLALIQASSLPDEAATIELSQTSPDLGDSLYSLAGTAAGSEGFWIYTSGEVRAVYERTLANGYAARTVEADMQTNQGNSGGPVVNQAGQLVAVVEGHMASARSVSMYVDVTEVLQFLDTAYALASPSTVEQFTQRGQQHYEAGRLDQALADFTSVLQMEQDNAFAMSSRGWIFYKRGDYQTALAAFDRAIQTDKTMLYAYHGRAVVEMDTGDYDEAIADLTHAIVNATDDEELAEYYNERGVAYSRLDDPNAALDDFDRAIAANDAYAWGHGNRGNMLILFEEYEQAADALRKAIDLDSTEPDFLWMMGQVAHEVERHEDALVLYEGAIELNPTVSDYWVERGKCLAEVFRYEDATQSLLKAIELDEENPDVYNDVGIVLFELGDYETARSQFQVAARMQPSEPMYSFNAGNSALHMHEAQNALADLNRAIKLDATADAYALRGQAYSLLGKSQQAQRDFDEAERLAPGNFHRFNSKYIDIVNRTGETLDVYVRYFAEGTDGRSRWYPTSGEPLVFEFAPGEESRLLDQQQLIHGKKFRVWAEGRESGQSFDTFKNRDLTSVGGAGYLSFSSDPEDERLILPQ